MSNSSNQVIPSLADTCRFYVLQCEARTGIVLREDGTYSQVETSRYECGGLKEALDYAHYWVEMHPDRDCVILDSEHRFIQRVWRPDLFEELQEKANQRSWWSWLCGR